MPNGELITGEDGIISLREIDTNDHIAQVPCLTQWTLDASASIDERSSKCMKSNGDGGDGVDANWTNATVVSKSGSLTLDFYWQNDPSILGGERLDPTHVGDGILATLHPDDFSLTGGSVVYRVFGIIESVNINSEVAGDIQATAIIKVSEVLNKHVHI